MTNKQVVAKLRELGHKVEVYVRKDGSLRVINIDGQAFERNQSKGVEAARNLLEKEASWTDPAEGARRAALLEQRKFARASRKSGKTLRAQPVDFQKEFKKLQFLIRKTNKKLIKEGKRPLGVPSWTKTREAASKAGLSIGAMFNRVKDYFTPLTGNVAPVVMVQAVIDKMTLWQNAYHEISPVREFLENNKTKIDIYALTTARNWAYTVAAGQKPSMEASEVLNLLKTTLHE